MAYTVFFLEQLLLNKEEKRPKLTIHNIKYMYM